MNEETVSWPSKLLFQYAHRDSGRPPRQREKTLVSHVKKSLINKIIELSILNLGNIIKRAEILTLGQVKCNVLCYCDAVSILFAFPQFVEDACIYDIGIAT